MYEYFQEELIPGLVTIMGVRTKKYKYIESPGLIDDIYELYDLEADPGEMNNVINDPGYKSVKKQMKKELEKLKSKSGDFHH